MGVDSDNNYINKREKSVAAGFHMKLKFRILK